MLQKNAKDPMIDRIANEGIRTSEDWIEPSEKENVLLIGHTTIDKDGGRIRRGEER